MKLQAVAFVAATVIICAQSARASEYEVAPLTPVASPPADTVESKEPTTQTNNGRPRIGVYGAAGFPSPLSVGALMMIDQRVLLGAEYGFLPVSQIAGIDVTYRSFAADARLFPFRGGPFFIGLRAGRQHLSGSKTVTVRGYGSATGSTTADSWFLNPRLGLFKMWDSGIFVGADVGLKIPISHTFTENVPYGLPLPSEVTTVRDTMSAKVIPTVTLLQLGIAF
jgi:hypothetical protein